MMALGTIIDQPVAAITMGVGAMLVGVAWRADGPLNPPIGTMSVAAFMLALSTLVGTVSGRWPWLHLSVLFVFCLLAGSASAIGRRGAVVGTQTLIAFIVFGRFPESVIGGLRLAGLVLAGGTAQVLFAALVSSPLTWRNQRRALAGAFVQLAELARQVTSSGVPSAEGFDAADQTLAAPALFGDSELQGLISLVAEGRRIRLELLVLSASLQRRRADPDVEDALAILGDALAQIATTLRDGDPDTLEATGDRLKRWSDARPRIEQPLAEARVAALGGQVRAAVRQGVAVVRGGGDSTWRLPHPNLGSRHPLAIVVADITHIRDAVSLSSPAGRHALRLAIVVAGTELLTQRLAIPRGYWAVVAAATVLRPNFGATFTRGAERMTGTVAGAVIATLIAMAIDPQGWGIVVTIAILATITYSVFAASFAVGTATLTAMIVFLLHGEAPDSATIALDRGLDTLVGGVIGLGATLLWPTWSAAGLPRLLAVLVNAQRDYLSAVLSGLLTGTPPAAGALPPLARHVRVAYSDAEASLLVARGEPPHDDDLLDAEHAAAALAALRRVTYGIHALRLASDPSGDSHLELSALGNGLTGALGAIVDRLTPDDTRPAPLPPLRHLYRASATALGGGIGLALDELVDAVDSAAAALDG